MDEHFHDIDHLFQKASQRHSELPSAEVWVNLEKDLQNRNMVSMMRKYKKWKWLASLLFIFSLAIGTYCFNLVWRYNNAVNKLEASNSGTVTTRSKNITGSPDIQKRSANIHTEKIGKVKNAVSEINEVQSADIHPDTVSKTIVRSKSIYYDKDKKHQLRPANSNTYQNPPPPENTHIGIVKKEIASQAETVEPKGFIVKGKKPDLANSAPSDETNLSLEKNTDATGKIYSTIKTADVEKEKDNDLLPSLVSAPLELTKFNTSLIASRLNTNAFHIGKLITGNGYRLHKRNTYLGVYTASLYYGMAKVSTHLDENRPDYREDNYQQIKNHEKNRLSNTIGFSLFRNIGLHWGIGSGLGQTTFITDIYAKPLVARKDNSGIIKYRISTSSGYAYYSIKAFPRPAAADSLRTLTSKSNVKYLSVPLGLSYYFKFGKFTIAPAVYVSVNFKTSGKIETVQSLEHTYSNDIQGLKSRYFDGSVRLGISYFLDRTIGISLLPYSGFDLSGITDGKPVTTRRNTLGLAGGINFHF